MVAASLEEAGTLGKIRVRRDPRARAPLPATAVAVVLSRPPLSLTAGDGRPNRRPPCSSHFRTRRMTPRAPPRCAAAAGAPIRAPFSPPASTAPRRPSREPAAPGGARHTRAPLPLPEPPRVRPFPSQAGGLAANLLREFLQFYGASWPHTLRLGRAVRRPSPPEDLGYAAQVLEPEAGALHAPPPGRGIAAHSALLKDCLRWRQAPGCAVAPRRRPAMWVGAESVVTGGAGGGAADRAAEGRAAAAVARQGADGPLGRARRIGGGGELWF